MITLPQELTDRILDFLHDDNESLSQCRSVCKHWLPCASYHLFHRLKIENVEVLEAVCAQSMITPYVISLHIKSPYAGVISQLDLPELSRLPSLQELILDEFHWDHLSDDAQRVLSNLLPKIIALELRRLVFPNPEAIRDFAANSLQRLRIDDPLYTGDPPMESRSTPSPHPFMTQLQHLSLPVDLYKHRKTNAALHKRITRYIPNTLTLLEIETTRVGAELVRRIGPSLQHLKLIPYKAQSQTADLSEFLAGNGLVHSTGLKSITIDRFVGVSDSLVFILCTITSPHLHAVILTGRGGDLFRSYTTSATVALAEKLMDPGLSIGYPKVTLRILYIVDLGVRDHDDEIEIHRIQKRNFHLLDCAGRLEVRKIPGRTHSYSPFKAFKSDIHLA